jgi:hypothetical protein
MTEGAPRRRALTIRAGVAAAVPIVTALITSGACIKAGYPLAPTGHVEIRKDTAGPLFAADMIDGNGKAILPRQSPYQTGVTLFLTEASEPAFAAFVDIRIEPPEALSLHAAQNEGTTKPTCTDEEGTFRCTAGKDGYAKFFVSSDGDWSGEATIVVSWAEQREERTIEILPAGLPDEATNFTLVAGGLDAASRVLPTFVPLQCTIGPVPDDLGSKWREGQIRFREAYVRATPPVGSPGVVEHAPVILESLHSEAALSLTQDCASRVTRIRVLLGATGESSPFYLCFSDIGGDVEFAVTSGQKAIEPNRQVLVDPEPRLLRVQTVQSVVHVGDTIGLFEVSAYNAERIRIQMPVDLRVDDDQVVTLETASTTLDDELSPATILNVVANAAGTVRLHVSPRLFATPDCVSEPVSIIDFPALPGGGGI